MSLAGRVGTWINQALNMRIGLARLTGLAGVILTFVGLLLHLVFVWALANMDLLLDGQGRDRIEELAKMHAFAALLALLGVLLSKRPPFSVPFCSLPSSALSWRVSAGISCLRLLLWRWPVSGASSIWSPQA